MSPAIFDTISTLLIAATFLIAFLLFWRACVPMKAGTDTAKAMRWVGWSGIFDSVLGFLFGGPTLLLSLVFLWPDGILVGAALCTAAGLALSGRSKYLAGNPVGGIQLAAGQGLVLGAVVIYCIFTMQTGAGAITDDNSRAQLAQLGMDLQELEAFAAAVSRMLYLFIILVTVLINGGFLVFYWRRRDLPLSANGALHGGIPGHFKQERGIPQASPASVPI